MERFVDRKDGLLINYGDGPRAIYKFLKKKIIAGELCAGEELKILPLAKEIDVSIVPVREAIRMLAAENLVELRPRRSPLIAPLVMQELVEMNQIRNALEPTVLADAVPHHTQKTLTGCQDLLDRGRSCTDPHERAIYNQQFHLAILFPSLMQRTISIIADQYDGIARFAKHRRIAHDNLIDVMHQEHEAILSAVCNQKKKDAVRLIRKHIEQATARAKCHLVVMENDSMNQQNDDTPT